MSENSSALRRYIDYYESLTAESVGKLSELAEPDMHFSDPFNEVHSSKATIAILVEAFEKTTDPKFVVSKSLLDGDTAFIKWKFTANCNSKKPILIKGCSEVVFSQNGLVTSHIDYWDAAEQLYEKIPVLGWILKAIRSKLAYKES